MLLLVLLPLLLSLRIRAVMLPPFVAVMLLPEPLPLLLLPVQRQRRQLPKLPEPGLLPQLQ